MAGGPADLWAAAFAPDGRTLATGGADHALALWAAATGHPQARRHGHGDEILSVAFSPDSRWVAAAGCDGTVRLWETAPPVVADFPAVKNPAGLSPSGEFVLEESSLGRVQIWNRPDARGIALPTTPPLSVLGFDRDGTTFATLTKADQNRPPAVQFWRANGEPVGAAVPLAGAEPDWTACAAAPAAGVVALAARRGKITLHDWRTGALRRELTPTRISPSRLLLSQDGRRCAAFVWPRQMLMFDTASGATRAKWRGTDSEWSAFAFSPDGRLLACGGADNRVTVFEADTGREVAVLRGHKAEIKALAFSPDGRTLASSSRSLTLKLWHMPTWRELATLADDKLFTFLAFSDDGTALFAGEYGKALHRFTAPRSAEKP